MSRRPSLTFRRRGRPPNIETSHDVLALFLAALGSLEDFQGACVDTGAERTVIGKPQAEAYCRWLGKEVKLAPTRAPQVYRFGGGLHPSVGKVHVRIPFDTDFVMALDVDVIDLNVPLLLGMSTMDEHGMYANKVVNRMVCVPAGVTAPPVRKYGHVYRAWTDTVLYTTAELSKLHRHFFHLQPERLFALLKQAGDSAAVQTTMKQLEDLSASCDICQRLARAPDRFRVSFPAEKIVFNRLILLDLMYLDGLPVLHVVDNDTLFSAATFLTEGETSEAIWRAYLQCWVTPYVGHPDLMHTDQGPQLISGQWRALLAANGIKHLESGVESHNSLGAGERYHAFMRQLFLRVRAAHPTVDREHALSLAVWTMNQTAGTHGLVPSLLVFGVLPRFPVAPSALPSQRERMMAVHTARATLLQHLARTRVLRALRSRVPAAADADIRAGAAVLVYRERPVDKWEGPYPVVATNGKQVWLLVSGRPKQFSIDKVKLYVAESAPAPPSPRPDATSQAGQSDAATVAGEPSNTVAERSPARQERDMGDLLDSVIAGDQFLTSTRRGLVLWVASIERAAPSVVDAAVTEVLEPGDPRANTPAFRAARKEEADGLRLRRTWDVVARADLPPGANIIKGRFVNALKHAGTAKEKAKGRFVAQGHKDKDKPFVVHNNPTLRQRSTKIIVSASAVLTFRVFSHDVNQSYLQSKDHLSREIYLQPRLADMDLFGLKEGECLHLLKPLYGICDAGDYWGITVASHIKEDLKMAPLTADPSLYYKMGPDTVDGLLGTYVDDSFLGGNEEFQEHTKKTLQRFYSKPRVWDNLEFLGVSVRTIPGGVRSFSLDQKDYILQLHALPRKAPFDSFVRARACFAWLGHSRPDLCCAINRAAQVTERTYNDRHVSELNKAMRYASETANLVLSYGRLDRKTLHLRAYADASFATNDDNSSQLGYIVLLADASNRCHVLSYASRKSRRVVRSIMAGEIYAFADAFDKAFVIKYDLERIYRQHLPLVMLTDSKQMFDVITRASHTTEKRLMIDVAAAREAYNRGEISNVGLVRSEHNVVDGLTKPGFCAAVDRVLRTGMDPHPVAQWIIRSPTNPDTSDRGMVGV